MMDSVGAAAFFRALKGAAEPPPRSGSAQDSFRRRFWTGDLTIHTPATPPIRTAGSATVTEEGVVVDG